MENRFDHALQFKVTLKGISPPIWRRVQVPCTYTFWDLHVAIQDAMGWLDCHLHLFRLRDSVSGKDFLVGIPDDGGFVDDLEILAGWDIPVVLYLTLAGRAVTYEYDFGDDWQHALLLEKIIPRDPLVTYPVCIGGRRACPPEDCGGIPGYGGFLEAIQDPTHEDHQSMMTWVGGAYDSEAFDKARVQFDDPKRRWHQAFREG